MLQVALLAIALFASELFAGPETVSGHSQTGLLYAITHLHPAAYFILFLVAVLSAVNLFFQARLSGGVSALPGLRLLLGRVQRRKAESSWTRGPLGRESSPGARMKSPGTPVFGISRELLEDGVVSVRRKVKESEVAAVSGIPTPLEGINHPLPDFASLLEDRSATSKTGETKSQKAASPADFKFSSAVDLPSPEEMERREKEQLVISGTVVGLDGEGIPDVLVYLTDEDGNRVGQSCRSVKETGEFKVLANEPGKYIISGHKRGLIMENSDPLLLPIQSGKLEGYGFRMIPEGCVVLGKVTIKAPDASPGGLEVRCVCAAKGFSRTAATDSVAGFRITGVPVSSQCILEVWNKDGELLASSESFETARKREVHLDVTVDALRPSDSFSSSDLQASDPAQTPDKDTAQPAGPLQ
jgi:hypothetical protein